MIASKGLIKGMSQDSHPRYQPENTYHSALNAIIETTDGEIMSISNELGNLQELTTYPVNRNGIPKRIIGSRLLDDGTTVLFLFDPAETRPDHEIGIWDPKQKKYTTYVYGTCLNFSDKHYINAVYRLKNGCERVVYFTDNYNPYRVINLDRPEYYTAPPDPQLISCDKLKYSRDFRYPEVQVATSDYGGNLKVGTYSFAIRYLDQDFNPTNWLRFTNSVPVIDDLSSVADPLQIDGAASNPDDVGYVVDTSNSINVTVEADTAFSYVQLGVIKWQDVSGAISGVDILTPVEIPQDPNASVDVTITYTGYPSQIESASSLEELFSEKLKVDKVAAHAIKDHRLMVANLTRTTKDYTGFQRYASAIRTQFLESHSPAVLPDSTSNHKWGKTDEYYFENSSLMYDEVYALGVVFVWNDGEESPVFHIPGRAIFDNTANTFGTNPYISTDLDEWDTTTITSDPNIYDPTKTKRWQVYNTYTRRPYESGTGVGYMGYYETSTTYPTINACNDDHEDGYWGRDWQGNLIEPLVTKIRHHRMPAYEYRATSNLADRRLGVRFYTPSNYPHPDIVGHYFVYGDRTYEHTIVDKGFLAPITGPSGGPYLYRFPNTALGAFPTDLTLYPYISPATLFEERPISGDYMTIEKVYDQQDDTIVGLVEDTYTNDIYDQAIDIQGEMSIYRNWSQPIQLNYRITEGAYLGKTQAQQLTNSAYLTTAGVSVESGSISTNMMLFTLDRGIEEVVTWADNNYFYGGTVGGNARTIHVSLKRNTEVFTNLYQINYKRFESPLAVHPPYVVGYFFDVFSGDTFVTYQTVLDKRWTIFSGDPIEVELEARGAVHVLESKINPGLRYGSTKGPQESYFKALITDSTTYDYMAKYLVTKYYEVVAGQGAFYPEAYLQNKAYNNIGSPKLHYPISQDYDFCSDCIEEYPYRIYASQPDDIERRRDAYRTILVNNYTDIDGNNGGITDLFVNFNQLYATTPFSTYIQPTSQQTLTTEDGESVYIGSGSIFQMTARPLKTADYAFAGQRYWKSRVLTEYGAFFLDADSYRPILLTDSLKDLSNTGLRNFFQKYSGLKFLDQFKLITGQDYTNTSTVSPYGVGYMSVYDPRHKRIILHKKDYTINESYANSFTYIPYEDTQQEEFEAPQALWYDGNKFYYNTSQVLLDNPLFFDNRSFTISYSFLNNAWTSFHSYFPYYAFSDNSTFYTDNIYTHHAGDYQTFYGVKHDHFIDIIVPLDPNEIKTFTSLNYVADTWQYSPTYESFVKTDRTFDKAVFYNSSQSSGYNYIIANPSPFQTVTIPNIVAKRTDAKWKINDPRDYTTSNFFPVWDNAPQMFSPETWTNREPNQGIIQYTKSMFELPRFKDYYQGVRLHFKPSENLKITTDLIQTLYTNKNR